MNGNTPTGRVFVTQHGQQKIDGEWVKRDVSDAERFGKVTELIQPGPMIRATPQVIMTLRYKLMGFSDDDYLLCMGDPAIIGMACVMAARANEGRYKLLVWDRESQSYFAVPVDTNARPVREEG
jgi:hypothetical protein